jgi:hypothetical protein
MHPKRGCIASIEFNIRSRVSFSLPRCYVTTRWVSASKLASGIAPTTALAPLLMVVGGIPITLNGWRFPEIPFEIRCKLYQRYRWLRPLYRDTIIKESCLEKQSVFYGDKVNGNDHQLPGRFPCGRPFWFLHCCN